LPHASPYYRLNRDIFIGIFDDRIEVKISGAFSGNTMPTLVFFLYINT